MSYLVTIHLIGGHGGSAFEMLGLNNGATLERIRVWVGGWQVKALKFWLTDGTRQQFGNPSGNFSEFQFKAGEHFTQLSLWGNGAGSRLGAIKFKTNKSREFFAHMTDWGLHIEYPIDVGSGICVGVIGRAGSDIDSLGFVFLNTIKSAVLKDVNYPTLHDVIPQVQVKEIKSVTYDNNTSVPQTHTIESSTTITTRSSWSVKTYLEYTYHLEVSAGIPTLGEISGGHQFTVGVEGEHKLEEEESHTEKVSYPVSVPPGKTVKIDITIGKVEVDLPYTATVEITCYNDKVWRFKTEGIYEGLTYTEIKVSTDEID